VHTAPDAVLGSLADPTCRALCERLSREGERTVRMLIGHADVSQPAVSKHPGVLKHAGLVRARRKGRQTHYSARPRGLAPLVDWMSFFGAFWRGRLDRLEGLLGQNGPMTGEGNR